MWSKKKIGKYTAMLICVAIFGAFFTYVYVHASFPEQRAEAKHLKDNSQMGGDCYSCHIKSTPKIAQDWYESKHGVLLVKCYVCHGSPDGQGAVNFSASPDPDKTCRKCHEPAMNRMQEKYGMKLNCNSCHPVHQNSIHHDAYKTTISKPATN